VANKDRSVVETGIVLGVIVLALVVVFAVGLPRWHKHDVGGTIALPATLSGGLTKAGSSELDAAILKQEQNATQVMGAATSVAEYTDAKQSTGVIVQATRTPVGALLPVASGTYTRVGEVYCLTDTSAQATLCRRGSGDLTVQVTASDATSGASYANEVYDAIAHKKF